VEVCAVLDLFLNWFVVAIPFLVTVGATVLALKLPHERHYWKFVAGAVVIGLAFSGLAYWQQIRATRQAIGDRDTAIMETSKRVAEETTKNVTKALGEQYKGIINSLTAQVGELKGQIAAQGRDVGIIKGSNIVTGKTPVKVEVINPTTVSGTQAPLEVEHVQLLKSAESSKYTDAPFANKLVLQSNVPINPARFAIHFSNAIEHVDWNPAQGHLLFIGGVRIYEKDPKVLIVNIEANGDAAVRPESPLVIHVSSANPISVEKFERGPQ